MPARDAGESREALSSVRSRGPQALRVVVRWALRDELKVPRAQAVLVTSTCVCAAPLPEMTHSWTGNWPRWLSWVLYHPSTALSLSRTIFTWAQSVASLVKL